MPGVTLIVEKETLARVDALVAERRARRVAPDAKAAERARELARTKGEAAAREFLQRSRPRRVSRMGVMIELVELGLAALKPDKRRRREARQPAEA